MDPARITKLLQPFLGNGQSLTPGDVNHISIYIDILLRWNARVNLTAIRDPEEIVTRHFAESFFAARHLFPERTVRVPHFRPVLPEVGISPPPATSATRLADVGSGAGFPGIPIKLWCSGLRLTLIESNQKKSVFLREVARKLTLTDIDIQNARAETLPPASFDVVTLRAVERFETVLPTAASLVAPQGRLALLIGSAQVDQAKLLLPTWKLDSPLAIPNSHSRSLLVATANPV
jgi:16S rRNA (guanine527-N7)-methyltransferase